MSLFHRPGPALTLWVIFTVMNILALIVQIFAFFLFLLTRSRRIERWLFHVGKAQDCAANASWFNGKCDETISNHVGRLILEKGIEAPWWAKVIDIWTAKWEPNHSVESVEFTRDDPYN